MSTRMWRSLCGALFVLLALSGCSRVGQLTGESSLVRLEQPLQHDWITLFPGESLGQTFTARYAGLQGIGLFLKPASPGEGRLILHLRASPEAPTDLAAAEVDLSSVDAPGFYNFRFSPINDSTGKDYYLFAEIGPGELAAPAPEIQAGIAPAEVYLDGALYRDHRPQEAQLNFRLLYHPHRVLQGLLGEGARWLLWLGAAILMFVLPGWALLSLLWRGWAGLHWAEKLGLAGGVSLALYPVLLLATHLIGLHLGPLYAWAPALFGLGFALWRVLQGWRGGWRPAPPSWSGLALISVIALVLFTRLWVVRGLEVSPWGDSVHHTLIAQLLVDNRGLFNTWEPYAPLETFTYHFGFHSLVAVYHWVTGLALPQAALYAGQFLNAAAAIFLFPLGMRLGRSAWAGLIAVLLGGLLLAMPATYVNWGRFTQIAGQAILPAVVYLAWILLERGETDRRVLGPAALALAGLAFTHYRVLIFAVLFLIVLFLSSLRSGGLRVPLVRFSALGLSSGLLFLPWFVHVFAGKLLLIFQAQVTTLPGQASDFTHEANAAGNLFEYLPAPVWLLAFLALAWGLWRRESGVTLLGAWWFSILLLANPQWLNLPGAGALTNFAVLIAAYFPASLLIAAAAGWIIQPALGDASIPRPGFHQALSLNTVGSAALAAAILVSGLWGARQRMGDLRRAETELYTPADARAAAWIRQNTPEDAVFLVNSFFAYGGTLIVGADGGWWLPLMTGRDSTLPPMTYGSERGPWPDYPEWINALTAQIQAEGAAGPDTIKQLAERGVTHVYIGQRRGRVNSPGPYLEPEALLDSPYFRAVYNQDRVWVFEFLEDGAQ